VVKVITLKPEDINMKKSLVVLFSGLILLTSMHCGKKDDSENQIPRYDTAFPHPFFPAWPGSYWIYSSDDTLKALNYKLLIYNKADYDAMPDYDTVVVIKLKIKNIFNLPDTFALLKGNEIMKSSQNSYRDKPFRPLYSTTMGTFYGSSPWQGHSTIGETIATDTTLTLDNHTFTRVVVCIWYDNEAAGFLGKWQAVYRREFWAEGTGLIRRDEKPVPSDPDNFVTTLALKHFYINYPPDK